MIVVPLWVALIIIALGLLIWLIESVVKSVSWLKTGRHDPKQKRRDHTKSSDVWKQMDP